MPKKIATYLIFSLCLALSCSILYVLPESFWITFNLNISQINDESIDYEKLKKLKYTYFSNYPIKCSQKNQNSFYCVYEGKKKSDQRHAMTLIKKNISHGFVNKNSFLKLIEVKLQQIKQYQISNKDLELKISTLDSKLDETQITVVDEWLQTFDNLNTQINRIEQKKSFFSETLKNKSSNKELYEQKLNELDQDQKNIKSNLKDLDDRKTMLNSNQQNLINLKISEKLNNQKIDILLERSSFLENVFENHKDKKMIPIPDEIQWRIENIEDFSYHFSWHKVLIILPLALLLFGLFSLFKKLYLKRTNEFQLSIELISDILNVPYLGDLNSFFTTNNDNKKA